MYDFYFGQYNYNNLDYFKDNYVNYLNVKIEETPHYRFLNGDIESYIEYLKISWSNKLNLSNKINKKIEDYNLLIKDVLVNGINEPVVCGLDYFLRNRVLHGNHRAAIAIFYNLNLPILSKSFLFNDVDKVNVRYGFNKEKLYQSIFYNGKKIIDGRRKENRADYIIKKDIRNKTILDIGCNIGANCISFSNIAKKIIGIDVSKKIINYAIKLKVFLNINNINYKVFDFSKDIFKYKVDVLFLFSVDRHINNNKNLAKYIKYNVSKIVYFETHEKSKIPIEIKKRFKQIILIKKYNNRRLYRCLK